MPFRTASAESVSISQPRLYVGDEVFLPGEPVTSWDYMTEFRIASEIRVDEDEAKASTGLPSMALLAATLQVDCGATGFRRVSAKLLHDGNPITVIVEVPSHAVANTLEVRAGVTLARELPSNSNATAHRKGSRVYWQPTGTRFELEGHGSGLPVEAFDFQAAGLPENAVWKLNFDPYDLDRPFLAAVRLLVNTRHPRSAEVLSGTTGLVHSVMYHGILEQILLTVAQSDATTNATFEEGTVGAVLNDLTRAHMGYSLVDAVSFIRNNPSLALSRLQSTAGFLQGKAT